MKASVHCRPELSRKAAITRIVISANRELTMPKPMSRRVPAAPPSRSGSFFASSSNFCVMS
jgi:hypothetical protein